MSVVTGTPTTTEAGQASVQQSGTVVPHSRMRRAVIRTVTASAQVPQFSLEAEIATATLQEARRELAAQGCAVTVTDLVHAAVARTLPSHRLLNAGFTEQAVVQHARVDLAFIVEVGDGMLTPVLRAADRLALDELANRRRHLTDRARTGLLGPADLVEATFTVSNLGTLGVRRFHAMVMPGQSAVLAVGAVAADGTLVLTLTVDHRVVDGATAARFLRDLQLLLEAPSELAASSVPGEGASA